MKQTLLRTELTDFPAEGIASPETFLQSSRNNFIGVEVYKRGNKYHINGTGSVLFTDPAGATTEITDGVLIYQNRIELRLPSSCYNQRGPVQFVIRNHYQGKTTTLGVLRGYVYP